MKRDTGFRIMLPLLLLAAGLLLANCSFRPEGADVGVADDVPRAVPANAAPAPQTTPDARNAYTVTYEQDGAVLYTETVYEGDCATAAQDADCGDRSFLGWAGPDGKPAAVTETPVTADARYTALAGPRVNRDGGYFSASKDGLFYPEESFTRSDAARAVYAFLDDKPKGETFLGDVTTRAQCYQAATALVTEGYMTLEGSAFRPDVAITRAELTDLLTHIFSARRVGEALAPYGDTLTRGQAAAALNALLGLPDGAEGAYYPDVSPESPWFGAISAAGRESGVKWTADGGKPQAGFRNLEGYLYYFTDAGYLLLDGDVGTLHFGPSGRYTCGDTALDDYVAEIVDAHTDPDMSRDEMLRAVYDYVRDHFLYLKRNLYEVGETGWAVKEALLMFQTGKGNCYNFTGAFWSLARGVGFDAVCYSGLVGVGRDPHSWTEIVFDGTPYIFDVETEMSYRLQDDYITSMYKITYERGELWSYAKVPYEDEPAA